jgi:hypothetical protein
MRKNKQDAEFEKAGLTQNKELALINVDKHCLKGSYLGA